MSFFLLQSCLFSSVYNVMGGEGWLRFPDLWSGQKSWWNWYLTPVVNFGQVRRVQLAKSTLLTFMQSWFLSLRWKTCHWAELQPWCLSLQWKTCPWAEHSDDDRIFKTKKGYILKFVSSKRGPKMGHTRDVKQMSLKILQSLYISKVTVNEELSSKML